MRRWHDRPRAMVKFCRECNCLMPGLARYCPQCARRWLRVGSRHLAEAADMLQPRATRVEAMLLKKGAVIVRGYTEVATLQGEDGSAVRITAIELSDTTHRAKEYGLAIEVSRGERRVVAYLDYDEIDEINTALA